jgi:antitoxin ParD1/3/4
MTKWTFRFFGEIQPMNISLTRELEEFVAKKVESGLYQTSSEVVREGLRLLRERDDLTHVKLDELRKAIALAIEQADQGKVAPLNAAETLAKIRKKRETPAKRE